MKAHYIQNKILFDWLAFSAPMTLGDIVEFLGLYDFQFVDTYGLYGYKNRIIFGGIGIHYGGLSEDRVFVEMSGQGCRTFETYGSGDYNRIFKYILENKKVKNEYKKAVISRLDVAYDDFNGLIDLEAIKEDVINHRYITKSHKAKLEYVCDNNVSSWTVYAGGRGSNISMRIYDKRIERNAADEFEHWVRCELQLRRTHAEQFIRFFLGGQAYTPDGDIIVEHLRLDSLYFSVLNHFIRFIDDNSNDDTNIWRKPMREHWERFAHSVTSQRVSLYVKPGVEYNILRLNHIIEEQYAGPIYTYIQIHGVKKLIDSVEQKSMMKLNPKYKDLIAQRQAELDDYWNKLCEDARKI